MAKIDLSTVMDAIAAALVSGGTVEKAYGYPAAIVQKRQAAVGYPTSANLGFTFGRGGDEVTIPVWIICGFPTEETTRDEVSRIVGSATDVKTSIESAMSSVDVAFGAIETYDTTGGAFIAVRFDCDVLA